MPYVAPSDRPNINAAIEPLAQRLATEIKNNLSLIRVYKDSFIKTADALTLLIRTDSIGLDTTIIEIIKESIPDTEEKDLASAVYDEAAKYSSEGAHLGELNYALSTLILRVTVIKVERGDWQNEIKYWMHPETDSALFAAALYAKDWDFGLDGVFLDVILEYKRRINAAYESYQIWKNGDVFDGAPYHTKPIPIFDNYSDKDTGKYDKDPDSILGFWIVHMRRDQPRKIKCLRVVGDDLKVEIEK